MLRWLRAHGRSEKVEDASARSTVVELQHELELARQKHASLEEKLKSVHQETVDDLLRSISQGACYGLLQVQLVASGRDVLTGDLTRSIEIIVQSLSDAGVRFIGTPGEIVEFDSELHAGLPAPLAGHNKVRIAVPGLISPSGTVARKAVIAKLG